MAMDKHSYKESDEIWCEQERKGSHYIFYQIPRDSHPRPCLPTNLKLHDNLSSNSDNLSLTSVKSHPIFFYYKYDFSTN